MNRGLKNVLYGEDLQRAGVGLRGLLEGLDSTCFITLSRTRDTISLAQEELKEAMPLRTCCVEEGVSP